MRSIRLVVARLVLILVPSTMCLPLAMADETALIRFQEEYDEALDNLEASYRQMRGECATLDPGWHGVKGQVPSEGDYDKVVFAVDLPRRIVQHFRQGNKDKLKNTHEHVVFLGRNSGYTLHREAGDDSYSVSGVGADPGIEGTFIMRVGMYITAPHGVMARTMRQIVSDSTFRLESAEPIQLAGHSCIRVKCETGSPGKMSKYTIVFDPSAFWIIRSAELQADGPLPIRVLTEVEYSPSDGQHPPLPKSVKSNGWEVCKFNRIERLPTPATEFSMTRFGLPDLSMGSSLEVDITWLQALLPLGIGCLAVSLLLRRITRKRISE